MSQSPLPMPDAAPAEQPRGAPRHVAIIMDGNGRWATQRGLPRTEGHRLGADAVRRTVEAAARAGVGTLTLYAFSSDNWKRPQFEVATLMRLLLRYLRSETPRCLEHGIRMSLDRAARPPAGHAAGRGRGGGERHGTGATACTCGWRWTTPRATSCCARSGASTARPRR